MSDSHKVLTPNEAREMLSEEVSPVEQWTIGTPQGIQSLRADEVTLRNGWITFMLSGKLVGFFREWSWYRQEQPKGQQNGQAS